MACTATSSLVPAFLLLLLLLLLQRISTAAPSLRTQGARLLVSERMASGCRSLPPVRGGRTSG